MVVYVEVVIFDNFCLDFLLAYLTLMLCGKKVGVFKVILSAVVGSISALFFPLVPQVFSHFYKVATLMLCSILFCFPCSLRDYFVSAFLYLILSFLLSGMISFLLGGNGNGLIGASFGGAVGVISASAILLIYAVRQIRGLVKQVKHREKRVIAELFNREKTLRLDALYDSGNLLTDQSGKGMVVTDQKRLSALGALSSVGEMRVDTASGSRILKLVKIPKIKIYSKEGENILTNVTAALSDLPDEYALILPCD